MGKLSDKTAKTQTEQRFRFPDSLLQSAFEGKKDAQEELWERTLCTAIELARIIGRRKGVENRDIEDIVQNAVISLYELPPDRLRDIKNWRGYLYRVVYHEVVNTVRRQIRDRKRGNISLDQPPNDSPEGEGAVLATILPSEHSGPLRNCSLSDLLREVDNNVLTNLPKEKAAVFRLYLQGLKYREISRRLDVKENTVSVWIYRIKKQCRQWWESQDAVGEETITE